MDQFATCWEDLEDPRTASVAPHDFNELLMIAPRSVLCGGQGAVDMGPFAWAKAPFLRGFLKLSNGLPSHDSFSRLFRRLDAEQFRTAFQRFMTTFSGQCQGVVAIEGKVLRRSFDRAGGKSPLHMVSAWGCEQCLVLAQIATQPAPAKACPGLDPGAGGGDYALAPKGNRGPLHDDVRLFLDDPSCQATMTKPLVEADHGRIETRTATVSTDIEWLQKDHQWPGLAAIGKVARIRETPDKTTTETAYYLLRKTLSAERFNEVIRHHWSVENRRHWRLDVIIIEDPDRTRLGNGPHNLAALRHMALNAMQKDTTKGSLRGKFKRASRDDAYLVKLLALF